LRPEGYARRWHLAAALAAARKAKAAVPVDKPDRPSRDVALFSGLMAASAVHRG
jgi:hypothetical protein